MARTTAAKRNAAKTAAPVAPVVNEPTETPVETPVEDKALAVVSVWEDKSIDITADDLYSMSLDEWNAVKGGDVSPLIGAARRNYLAHEGQVQMSMFPLGIATYLAFRDGLITTGKAGDGAVQQKDYARSIGKGSSYVTLLRRLGRVALTTGITPNSDPKVWSLLSGGAGANDKRVGEFIEPDGKFNPETNPVPTREQIIEGLDNTFRPDGTKIPAVKPSNGLTDTAVTETPLQKFGAKMPTLNGSNFPLAVEYLATQFANHWEAYALSNDSLAGVSAQIARIEESVKATYVARVAAGEDTKATAPVDSDAPVAAGE